MDAHTEPDRPTNPDRSIPYSKTKSTGKFNPETTKKIKNPKHRKHPEKPHNQSNRFQPARAQRSFNNIAQTWMFGSRAFEQNLHFVDGESKIDSDA